MEEGGKKDASYNAELFEGKVMEYNPAAVAWGLSRKTGAGARSGADAEGATFFAGAHATPRQA